MGVARLHGGSGRLIAWRTGVTLRALYLMLVLVVAASVSYIDTKHRVIPNELVLAVIVLSAAFGLTGVISFHIGSSLLGFAVCFAVFLIPCVWKRRIGAGDVKLAAAMGFALGLTDSLYAIVCLRGFVLLYLLVNAAFRWRDRFKSMIPRGRS
jgi:leader peptidase (prepilin peptidase)/N-methyltransferase